jgi:hypothetical protein
MGMYAPWQMAPMGCPMMYRPSRRPLQAVATGGFPVPESLPLAQWPPAVRASMARLFQGPPKPAVTLQVMNEAQQSMIAPDLPNRSNV